METIIAINLFCLTITVLYLLWTIDLPRRDKEFRHKTIADHRAREIERLDAALCAVPANKHLFLVGSLNVVNNWEFPETSDRWPKLVSFRIGECCEVYYLVPEPLPLGTYEFATGGVDKYQPWADVNRYAAYCGIGCREYERCAVCKKLREMCSVRDVELVAIDPYALVARRDDDGLDGDAGITYVGDGDGRCGPVSAKFAFREREVYRALDEACKACAFKREDGDEKCAASVEMRPEVAHGGIIPFLKRLFGRKAKEGARQ